MPEGINQKIYWVLDQQERGNSCGRCDQISVWDDQSTLNYWGLTALEMLLKIPIKKRLVVELVW